MKFTTRIFQDKLRECEIYGRSVAILAPMNARDGYEFDEFRQLFSKHPRNTGKDGSGFSIDFGDGYMTLFPLKMRGAGCGHYNTVTIVNPQKVEDKRVVEEARLIAMHNKGEQGLIEILEFFDE